MNTIGRRLCTLMSTAVLVACSNFTVDSDYTPDTDFDSYKTYRWYDSEMRDPASLELLGGDIFDRRVRDSINAELRAKGFILQQEGEVDFKINYGVLTEDRQDIRTYNTYGGYAPGWGYGGGYGYGGLGTTSTQVINYKQGQLIIDIIDPQQEVLVWRGTAEGRIPKNESPEKREQGTRELIAKILSNFPPQTTSGTAPQKATSAP